VVVTVLAGKVTVTGVAHIDSAAEVAVAVVATVVAAAVLVVVSSGEAE
jgi:hypothetical protein